MDTRLRTITLLAQSILTEVETMRQEMEGTYQPNVIEIETGGKPPRTTDDSTTTYKTIDVDTPADFAIRLTGLWEGNTFGWHGEPNKSAYGIMGWEGDLLSQLQLQVGNGNPSPDEQMRAARAYYNRVMRLSCMPRGINTLFGRAMAFDMAVNNGMYHNFFQEAEFELGLADRDRYVKPQIPASEFMTFIRATAQKRYDLRKHLFTKYPGLRLRYEWWLTHGYEIDEAAYDEGILVAAKRTCVRYTPSEQSTFAYCSPVSPRSRELWGGGWYSAMDYGQEIPVNSYIPKQMHGKLHTGYDLNLPSDKDRGAAVHAIADGEVVFAGEAPQETQWGGLILIRHDGACSRYGHVNSIAARAGQRVKAGEQIAVVGNGGGRYPYHLHFDMPLSAKNPFQRSYVTKEELGKWFIDPKMYIERGR